MRRAKTDRVSILFVLPSLQGGGAERMVVTILRNLDQKRFAPVLAVLDGRDPVYAADLPPGLQVIDLGTRRMRSSVAAIIRLVWRVRPDIVFTTIAHLNLGTALARSVFPRGVRLVAREAGVVSEVLRSDHAGVFWRFGYRVLYRFCDRIVCQSEYMRDDLLQIVGIRASKAVVIYNPVDLARIRELMTEPIPAAHRPFFDDGEGAIRLVAIGRLSHEKGFDLLIRAVALCRDPRLRLIILGTGVLRATMEKLASDLGVRDQVNLIGFQKNPYAYISRADALVLSSRHEGLPNVVLEAMACSTPVIATPAPGGIFELLDGCSACVIASDVTAESLAATIKSYPFKAKAVQSAAALERFSIERIVGQYESLFDSLARGAA
ncbi:MAG TPA: glycosyltransferase [Gemmatimonadaceae bacterium]|nr:glycosyltransferase [Gemmatimonadaceae bacterium]